MQKRAADTSGSLCVACSTAGNKEFPFSLQKGLRDFASFPRAACALGRNPLSAIAYYINFRLP